MLEKKRIARAIAIAAGISMFALAGPAAVADDDTDGTPTPEPTLMNSGNGSEGENCVIVVRPEKVLKNGKVVPAKTRVSDACVQEREQKRDQKAERTQLREEVREAGGSWGAVVRQQTLIRVATRLAERDGQSDSAALGRILTLINTGVPGELQYDVASFCLRYELLFDDLVTSAGDDDEADDETEPEPNPTVS